MPIRVATAPGRPCSASHTASVSVRRPARPADSSCSGASWSRASSARQDRIGAQQQLARPIARGDEARLRPAERQRRPGPVEADGRLGPAHGEAKPGPRARLIHRALQLSPAPGPSGSGMIAQASSPIVSAIGIGRQARYGGIALIAGNRPGRPACAAAPSPPRARRSRSPRARAAARARAGARGGAGRAGPRRPLPTARARGPRPTRRTARRCRRRSTRRAGTASRARDRPATPMAANRRQATRAPER